MNAPRGEVRLHSRASQAVATRSSGKNPSGAKAATLAAPRAKAMRVERRREVIIKGNTNLKRILLTNFHPHPGGGGGHARYIRTILASDLRKEFEFGVAAPDGSRSEERRVGKERRSRQRREA